MTIEEYIEAHIEPEPAELQEVYRRTYLSCTYPRMCSGHLQGRILKMLTMMISPKRIIELGSYTGYSAMSMAEGMPAGAELHTIEANDEMEELLRSNISLSARAADIHVHIGDAEELLPAITAAPWDMAFIDANKRHYCRYLDLLLPRMAPGGYILADNTLWGGKLNDPNARNSDPQSRGIAEFNERVAADKRFMTVMLPLRDGLTVLKLI